MSILVNKDSRVITQGMTGKTGSFHTRACVEYVGKDETPYDKFIRCQFNVANFTNGDGIAWDDDAINRDEINDMMLELS